MSKLNTCNYCLLLCLMMCVLGLSCFAYSPMMSHHNYTTVYVDPAGHGDFQTIQSAIDSVPQDNKAWICIYVKAGTYREQVTIPREKPFIYLKGEGKRKTNIIWESQGDIENATFSSFADNIVVKSMTFINSHNFPPESTTNRMTMATAAYVKGDNTAFYRCGFKSLQDTLWDAEGHHYYKRCTINGGVDFIFGNAQSIFEECSIAVHTVKVEGTVLAGFITAQGRKSAEENTAFVFKNCHVFGTAKTYLGRPWGNFARVIFYNTFMDDVIVPQRWNFGYNNDMYYQLTYVEHGCSGPGSNKLDQSEPPSLKMSDAELRSFTTLSYVNNQGWLYRQPLPRLLQ